MKKNSTGKSIYFNCHESDLKRVKEITDRIAADGYRICHYQAKKSSKHLKDEACCIIAFISKAYIDSPGCRQDISVAVNSAVPFVSIVLEEVEFPPGLELQISSFQLINSYLISDNELMERLQRSGLFEDAVVSESEKAAPVYVRPKKRIKPVWVAGFIGAVMAVAFILWFIGNSVLYVKIGGMRYRVDEEYLTVENVTIDKGDISRLRRMKDLRLLDMEGCTFSEGSASELSELGDRIVSLQLKDCTGISGDPTDGWKWLSDMHRAEWVYIINCELKDEDLNTIDLSGLKNLKGIDISGNKGISDLNALLSDASPDITSLIISDTSVSDLSPVSGFTSIQVFEANDCRIASLEPLSALTCVQILRVSHNELTDLNGLGHMSVLRLLTADGNNLSSIEGLSDCISLKQVELSDNHITDISPLQKSTANIEALYLAQNGISDISVLERAGAMYYLCLDHNEISDISALRGMHELNMLSAQYNRIGSLEPVTDLKNLSFLYLGNNELTGEVSFGRNFALTEGVKDLYLQNNDISSLVFSRSVPRNLAIYDNPLREIRVIDEDGKEVMKGEGDGESHNIPSIRDEDSPAQTIGQGDTGDIWQVYMSWGDDDETALGLLRVFDNRCDIMINGCPADLHLQAEEINKEIQYTTSEYMDELCEARQKDVLGYYPI